MHEDGPTFNYPHKTELYTYRVPTPPRILVPPPSMADGTLPELRISRPHFLPREIMHYSPRIIPNAQIEWTYERRRQAQAILPYLYLGPMTVAKNETWLRHNGITMVLGVRQSKIMDVALARARNQGIDTHVIDVANHHELVPSFPVLTKLIMDHIVHTYRNKAAQGKVLVFCESGNDRSAAVVAAYLMEAHNDVDYIKAMQLCQAQRFCVNFDDIMKRLLQAYWDILCAKREVAGGDCSSNSNNNPKLRSTSTRAGASASPRNKRQLDRDEEMGGMNDDDDLERFEGRMSAPFVEMPL